MSVEKHPVYGTPDNWFYSDYVSRDFGVNCCVTLNSGEVVLNVVQPANEHVKNNLPIIGCIEAAATSTESTGDS